MHCVRALSVFSTNGLNKQIFALSDPNIVCVYTADLLSLFSQEFLPKCFKAILIHNQQREK